MNIINATIHKLKELKQPVISEYDICMITFNFYQTGKYQGEKLEISTKMPSFKDINNEVIKPIIDIGILDKLKEFSGVNVFRIVVNQFFEAGDIICSIDPFSYISHLSAMEYHGLTNRIPKILFISTPPIKEWTRFANDKMENDCEGYLKDYLKCGLPKLSKIKYEKILKKQVIQYSSLHRGAFKHINERSLRVATIGRTFLDMLRKPNYCGGMNHVIEIYREFGKNYNKLIIDEIDRNGKSIEKARAGYILEEYCNINDEKINTWAANVQRGGSRKLDPESPYHEEYSEKWCISINV